MNLRRLKNFLFLIAGIAISISLVNASIHHITAVVAKKAPKIAKTIGLELDYLEFERASYVPLAKASWQGVSFQATSKEDSAILKKDLPLTASFRSISIKPTNLFFTKWLIEAERIIIQPSKTPISKAQAFDSELIKDRTIHLSHVAIPFSVDLIELEKSVKEFARGIISLIQTGKTNLTFNSKGELFYELNNKIKQATLYSDTYENGEWGFKLEESDIWELNRLFDNLLSEKQVKLLSSRPFDFSSDIKAMHSTHQD